MYVHFCCDLIEKNSPNKNVQLHGNEIVSSSFFSCGDQSPESKKDEMWKQRKYLNYSTPVCVTSICKRQIWRKKRSHCSTSTPSLGRLLKTVGHCSKWIRLEPYNLYSSQERKPCNLYSKRRCIILSRSSYDWFFLFDWLTNFDLSLIFPFWFWFVHKDRNVCGTKFQ